MMLLTFLLAGVWWGEVRAWYNTSGLPDCPSLAQDWRDLATLIDDNQVWRIINLEYQNRFTRFIWWWWSVVLVEL